MKIRYAVAVLCVLFVATTKAVTMMAISGRVERNAVSFNTKAFKGDPISPLSEGVLSSGIPYMFFGDFDFLRYREAHGFHWERALGGSAIANSPTEAAELAQFYLFPQLNNNPHASEVLLRSALTIVVRYYPQMDSWIVQYTHMISVLDRELFNRRMRDVRHVFAINRTTGSVVEYFDNGWNSLHFDGHTNQFRPEDAIRQAGWQRTVGNDMLHHPSKGILSTRLPYIFFGEFDFLRHRKLFGFYWERAADGSAIANSPTEAAVLGRFYLSRSLSTEPNWDNNRMMPWVENITVLYCPQTDNWVVQWNFDRRWLTRGAENAWHMVAINRSTGSVVEYLANWSTRRIPDSELSQSGWQRTLGVSTDPEEGFWQRVSDRVADFFQRFTR